jgi:serine protease Do
MMETPHTPNFFRRIRDHRLASAFTLLTTLTVGILAGSVLTRDVNANEQQIDTSEARPLVIPNPTTLSNGFSAIVKQVGPAVVNINTETLPKKAAAAAPRGRRSPHSANPDPNMPQGPDQGEMQDFFNKFFGGQNGGQNGGSDDEGDGPAGGERQALGSGFIVDPRGYIITNHHVIDKADKIFVKLAGDPNDGSRLQGRPATVVGYDTETDIAVIKIDTKTPLPVIKLGNSESSQVGDWVLAIGSPFSLEQTVTAGIISAKNRSIDDRDPQTGTTKQFQRFIQTDAAINPGNSGGPLVDMAGNVVGMNTAIYTQSMGSQGVGFAMPSNVLAKVYNDLIGPSHKVVRGSIGIQFQAGTPSAVSRVYGFSGGGVIVKEVTPNGGAGKAGIRPDDILVSVGGKQIKDGDDLVNDISARSVGSSVEIGYLRDGTKHTANVVIGDRAKVYEDIAGKATEEDVPAVVDAGQTKLGITVTPIPATVGTKAGIKGGVVVTSVTPGSFADDIGLGKGLWILEINKIPVTDEASYRAIVTKIKTGDDVVFVVRDPHVAKSGNNFVGGTLR